MVQRKRATRKSSDEERLAYLTHKPGTFTKRENIEYAYLSRKSRGLPTPPEMLQHAANRSLCGRTGGYVTLTECKRFLEQQRQ